MTVRERTSRAQNQYVALLSTIPPYVKRAAILTVQRKKGPKRTIPNVCGIY